MKNEAQHGTAPNRTPSDRQRGERGSAMIVALMIMIILTLLGVTFLVLAEQEQQIAVNERDLTQVLYAAEAGVEVAKTWFNKPDLADNSFKPPIADMTFDVRSGHTIDGAYDNATERSAPEDDLGAITYTGGKGIPFEKEYRPDKDITFWGRRESPDVLVCQSGENIDLDGDTTDDCNSGANGYMADLNDTLLSLPSAEHSDRDFGEVLVQQIRVYRPPLDFDLFTRYGIATIEAIAVKKISGGKIVTERAVRDVIQEVPYPGPGGAIETESDVGQNGSAGVHWGPVVSAAFDNSTDHINLPNRGNNNFPEAAVPRITSARWGFHHTLNPASGGHIEGGSGQEAYTALTELVGLTREGVEVTGNREPIGIGDPWLLFRARNLIYTDDGTVGIGSGPHPNPYNDLTDTVNNQGMFESGAPAPASPSPGGGGPTWSHMFQNQIVRFPPIDYDVWKEIVRTGQEGMFYMKYANADPEWRLNGTGPSRPFAEWVNNDIGLGAGVYFFDTVDSVAPRDDDADGEPDNLAPSTPFEKPQGANAYMEGFALLYAESFDSTGVGVTTDVDVNMPGEIFLDDGLDLHDGTGPGDNCICIRFDADEDECVLALAPIRYGRQSRPTDCGPAAVDCRCSAADTAAIDPDVAEREAATFRNGRWDADLNNDGVADGEVDSTTPGWSNFIAAASADGMTGHSFGDDRIPHYPSGRSSLEAGRFDGDRHRDPRFMNAAPPGSSFSPGSRQPHEPFLNFDYPTNGATIVGWGNATQNALLTDYDASGDAVQCERNADGRQCNGTITKSTSVARDRVGALMTLGLHVNGVLYCEGFYTGTGQMKVFGSMMMRGGYQGGGSLDVWFNEELVEGDFPPVEWELPRIFTSARDTD